MLKLSTNMNIGNLYNFYKKIGGFFMDLIGYFKIYIENEKYIGGIMITDNRGIPLEFKYTEPVEPTKIQKVLYGDVLEKYLREEVIMTNLISKVEKKPILYFVDNDENLYLDNISVEEVILIKSTQLNALKEVDTFQHLKDDEYVIQLKSTKHPVRVKTEEEGILDKIISLKMECDISEPLNRIEEALSLICKGEL